MYPAPRKITIAVDVDQVVADLLPAWLEAYNADYNQNLQPYQVLDWDISKFVIPACGRKIYNYIDDPELYSRVKPMLGALDAIARLRASGHRVAFVTSATVGSAGRKLLWLQDNGFLKPRRKTDPDYIECSDKSLIRAELLVDDRPKNIEAFQGWTIMFEQPHNRMSLLPRVRTWSEVLDRIRYLLVDEVANGRNPDWC